MIGGTRSQPWTDRLFFAIFPDEEAAAHIARLAAHLRAAHNIRGEILQPDRLHVTLQFLGDFVGMPSDTVASVSQIASTVSMPGFPVSFDRVRSFIRTPRRRPLVLCGTAAPALLALQRALAATLDELGIRRDTAGPYTPHITLLYDDVAIPEQPVAAVTWNVNEFRLIDRRRGQHEFRVLGRWALG